MKHIAILMSASLALGVAATGEALAQTAASDPQQFTKIERGRYLSVVGDCASCHTVSGAEPYAGGLELNTPFGTLLSANITSDQQTGIGAMTLEEFRATMRDGRGRHDKRLYPAMPYPSYTLTTDDDIAALYAYFQTIPAVSHDVQTNQLSFPFSLRADMAVWNLMEFDKGPYQPDASQTEEWNRGAYLVNGLGHCNTCHTTKNLLFGDKSGREYEGGLIDGWFAPNITGSKQYGLGDWSVDEVVSYLKTGANDRALASAGMAEVIVNSTSQMTDPDIRAMAVYLKSLEPSKDEPVTAVAADDPAMVAGAAIYKDNCAACHQDSGEGNPSLFLRLAGSSNVRSTDPTTGIRKIISGSRAVATDAAPTAPAMPSLAWRLDDQQIADVVTYIRNSGGNAGTPVSARTVKAIRKSATH